MTAHRQLSRIRRHGRLAVIAPALGGVLLGCFTGGPAAHAQSLIGEQPAAADTAVGRPLEAPVNTRPLGQKWWWNDDWYERGQLTTPANHKVVAREISYTNPSDGTDVPAILFRPEGEGAYPAILFLHGRRGLDGLVRRLPLRMAARGFVVLAPNLYDARFIDKFPLSHDPATEGDADAAIDFLLKQPGVSTSKLCIYGHTRGGYYGLRVAVTFARQKDKVACYAATYPHLQDPNASEPYQVYRYAPELDRLEIPALILIGEYEQYQRRRSIETAVLEMKKAKRDVRLVVYPGVGRGFDFRPPGVRTFADDLAAKDATVRAAAFMRKYLEGWRK